MIKWSISFIFLFVFSIDAEARKVENTKRMSIEERKQRILKRRELRRQARMIGFVPGEKAVELLLGQPSGVRYQNWLESKRAYNLDLTYHTKEQVLLSAGYIWYNFDARDKLKRKDFWNKTYFYYGPGIFTGKEMGSVEDDFLFGVKGFVGIDYLFVNTNYAVRTEAALAKYIVGDSSFGLQLFIGLSYHWDRQREKTGRRIK